MLVRLFNVSWKSQASYENQVVLEEDPVKDDMAVGVEAELWGGAALLLWREAVVLAQTPW